MCSNAKVPSTELGEKGDTLPYVTGHGDREPAFSAKITHSKEISHEHMAAATQEGSERVGYGTAVV